MPFAIFSSSSSLDFFSSIFGGESAGGLSLGTFTLCTVCSLILGAVVAAVYSFRASYGKGFLLSLIILPAIVQAAVMLASGSVGTAIIALGAFGLLRLRASAGSVKETCFAFWAMAMGLATGTGYLTIAALFAILISIVLILCTVMGVGEPRRADRYLRITVPEGLDYNGAFEDLFRRYAVRRELRQIKTSNMGSLFRLDYTVTLKNPDEERAFLDELRRRNGNLEIICAKAEHGDELR